MAEVILATEDGRLQIHMFPPQEDHEPSFTLPHLHVKVQSPLLEVLKKKETTAVNSFIATTSCKQHFENDPSVKYCFC